ncbi:MAG: acyl-CoA carboxylase subunit epsilon [Nocardioidaceae bacterium]
MNDRTHDQPVLRDVRGDPTDDEVAALIAVLAARARAATTDRPPPRRSEWASHERRMRRPLTPAPGAWRASALPR